MKRLLLFLMLSIGLSVQCVAQATANPAPDLSQCGNEVFDLTQQDATILGSQMPPQFTVGYHTTLADAEANANSISNPTAFVSPPSATIFARVTNTSDDTFATSSFLVSWEVPFNVSDIPDVTACDSYTLLPVFGIYYSTDLAGTVAAPGTITTTMTIYRHLTDFPCSIPSSFVVTIIQTPIVYDQPDVFICDFYFLPPLQYGNYYDSPGGTGNLLFAGDVITASMTIYIYATTGNCSAETSFDVSLYPSNPYYVIDVTACDLYVLPALPPQYEYYGNISGMGYEPVPVGTIITQSTPMQVVGDFNCGEISDFFIAIGDPPHGVPTPLVGCDANGDGFGLFNLNERVSQIRNGFVNVVVSFHETLVDAENGTAALLSPYANIVQSAQTVYARIENPDGGCYSTVALQLATQVCGSISGTVRFDSDNNGCTVLDPVATNKMLRYENNSGSHYAYTNSLGQYTFTDVYPGSVTVLLTTGNGTVGNPGSQTLSVLPSGNYTADFCIVPSQSNLISDARVYLSASNAARPGFSTGYNIIVRNEGNTPLTGTVTFSFDDNLLNFIVANPAAASQTANTLTFDVSGLSPAQYQIYNVAFMVEEPPTANSGDLLDFSTVMNNSQTDNTPLNNTALYTQEVVNSYDPNDIMVQQGEFIYQENMPEELVYTVRFQNTGTASAINVRIETILDDFLDASSFRPIAASHGYVVERNYENRVVFRFNGINLAASADDEPASHGYVVFAAKPSWLLQLGSIVSAQANIFFDFNAPITTNTVTTQVVNLLGTDENRKSSFNMYPNPAAEMVTIESSIENFEVAVYDIQGKKIMKQNGESELSMDVSWLQSGMYFVKVTTENASETKKLIVK